MTFAKGIANGYPLGATITTPEIAAAVTHPSLSTYGGNPVAMATALATVEYIERRDRAGNAARQGGRRRQRPDALPARLPVVGRVRRQGLLPRRQTAAPG